MSADDEIGPIMALTDSEENRKGAEIAERLRLAVAHAGGLIQVGAASGIPTRTLSRYLAGNGQKAHSLVALADACGVSIEWLLAGRGAMLPTESAAVGPATAPPVDSRGLFATVHVDKLAGCFEAAKGAFAGRGEAPTMRRIVQVALVLYDALEAQDADLDALAKAVTSRPPRDVTS